MLRDSGVLAVSTSPVGREVALFAISLAIIPYYLESRKDFGKDSLQQEPFRPFPFLRYLACGTGTADRSCSSYLLGADDGNLNTLIECYMNVKVTRL